MRPEDFNAQYLRQARRLYSVAYHILGNAEDAEDAVHDAYIRLWERAERLPDVQSAEAFFATAVRNVCLNTLRGRHGQVALDAAGEVPDAPQAEPADRSLWRRVLAGLSPKARRIVTLRHLGEYATRDIALLTGETETNVRSILSRSRTTMRDAYRDAIRRGD